MSNLVLCCGKVCSGKSTFSTQLRREHAYYRFSSDQWMLHFYEPTPDRELFDARLATCEEMIYRVSEDILAHGGDVVLDAGFWKKTEREELRKRFTNLGHRVMLVYFPITLERQLAYMEQRNREKPDGNFTFDRATVEMLNRFFEEPGSDELNTSSEEFLSLILSR